MIVHNIILSSLFIVVIVMCSIAAMLSETLGDKNDEAFTRQMFEGAIAGLIGVLLLWNVGNYAPAFWLYLLINGSFAYKSYRRSLLG